MTITSKHLIRWAGIAAIISGFLYMLTQVLHPAEELAAVSTDAWLIAHMVSFSFAVFGILGLVGLYAKQAKEAGWLGLIGFIMFFLALVLLAKFLFVEAFVAPILVTDAPEFVEELLAIALGESTEGVLAILFMVNGLLYLGGGLVFGIATIRANVLPRWGAILFTAGAVLSLASAIAEPLGRLSTFVLGAGLIWMGFALWTDQQRQANQSLKTVETPA